ncbi:MAG: hypothetical protein BRD46_03950 [Bacteroidetes bacterium QS_8_68_15]|nr:MAG: hypothetical protein BRD46_03950 [Bacteroidetes bacterium QS_8_68_15]
MSERGRTATRFTLRSASRHVFSSFGVPLSLMRLRPAGSFRLMLLLVAGLSASGCASTSGNVSVEVNPYAYAASSSTPAQTPVQGVLYTDARGPVAVTADTTAALDDLDEGEASAESILGLVGTGDASIEAAMDDGDLSRIHYVDYETENYLGIYAKFTVVVYGE